METPLGFQTPERRSRPPSGPPSRARNTLQSLSRQYPAGQREPDPSALQSLQHHRATPIQMQGQPQSSRRSLSSAHGTLNKRSLQKMQKQVEKDTSLKLFAMRGVKRPEVWQFIRLVAKNDPETLRKDKYINRDASGAFCLVCKVHIKYEPGSSGSLDHMMLYHPDEMSKFLDQKTKLTSRQAKRSIIGDMTSAATANKQQPIRKITKSQQDHVNKLFAEWTARHFRPMSIVEDESLIKLVKFLSESLGRFEVHVPKRTELRQHTIYLAADLRRKVKKEIEQDCDYFSFTSDIWTSRNAHSYISCTLHYVTAEFEMKNWTLEVRELPGMHDGPMIADALENILHEWSLQKQFCTQFVRDGGSNIVSAGEILGVRHMSCVAHTIHLIVGGALLKKTKKADAVLHEPEWAAVVAAEGGEPVLDNEEDEQLSVEEREEMDNMRDLAIDELDAYLTSTVSALECNGLDYMRKVVQRFRTLSVYFRRSQKGRNRLSIIQMEEFGVRTNETLNLLVDCPTRWNSTWIMLSRLIHLQQVIAKFFGYLSTERGQKEFSDVSKKLYRPTAADWFAIRCLQILLRSFNDATTMLGGVEYPTMPIMFKVLAGIRMHLECDSLFAKLQGEVGDCHYADDVVAKAEDCRIVMLSLYNGKLAGLENAELAWVAYLDPRVARTMPPLTSRDSHRLVAAAVELSQADERRMTPVHAPLPGEEGFMQHFVLGPEIVAPPRPSELMTQCHAELNHYLNALRQIERSQDPCYWWKSKKASYPLLSKLARKWLGAVATSVASERAFSTSGNIVTLKRGSLAPSMLSNLVFVSDNSPCERDLLKANTS